MPTHLTGRSSTTQYNCTLDTAATHVTTHAGHDMPCTGTHARLAAHPIKQHPHVHHTPKDATACEYVPL